jgi:hypothetical protein
MFELKSKVPCPLKIDLMRLAANMKTKYGAAHISYQEEL